MKLVWCRRLPLALAAIALLVPAVAKASDYSHICRTADGGYVIVDGEMFTAGDFENANEKNQISYRVLGEIVLQERKGYCLSGSAEATGRRFEYHTRSYVLRLSFEDGGRSIETYALCELSADGLPANLECTKEVPTQKDEAAMSAPRPGYPRPDEAHK